jgi:putative ABC transport system permease protein
MNWMTQLFSRRRLYGDLSDEIEQHLEEKIEELVANGMPREEAALAARREFGNLTSLTERSREVWQWPWIENFLMDIRYALRQLRRKPGFTAAAVLTLALGIGATTAIFSVVDSILLRPLPYQNPQQLALIQERLPNVLPKPIPLEAPDVITFERETHAFSALGAFQNEQLDVTGGAPPERLMAARITANLFPLLGVRALIGRSFTKAEDQPNRLVVLLSYGLWQRRFGGDRAILGKTISLDRESYVVVGVMPRDFQFPSPGLRYNNKPADLWVPMGFTAEELKDIGDSFDDTAIARLKPGVTLPEANADLSAIAHGIQATLSKGYPGLRLEAQALPLKNIVVRQVRPLLLILMGAVALVLLIACVNVASLLFVRAAEREKEIAVRAALGAGRLRVARGLLAESVLLGILGGACGLVIAVGGMRLLVSLTPMTLLRTAPIGLNLQVLGFAIAVSVITGLIFGLLPARGLSRLNLNEALKEGSRTSGSAVRHRTRSVLVVAEIALSVALLAGAGLLIRSFERVRDTDPGFAPEHVLTATVPLDSTAYGQPSSVRAFWQQLLERLRSLPGVRGVGASSDLPLGSNWNHLFTVEEHPRQPSGRTPMCDHTIVAGGYFHALGIPLIRGRYFTPDDRAGSLRVIIVSEGLAKKYWPGEDPIGKRIKWGVAEDNAPWLTVVGVVGDVKHGPLDLPTRPHTYQPLEQVNDGAVDGFGRSLRLVVLARGDPTALTATLRAQLRALDPGVPLTQVRAMDSILESSMSPRRFTTLLLVAFAAVALLLASIGLYGVIAYSVGQRTHEFGIRMALGAQKADVLRLVVRQGMILAIIGVGIGIAGALGLTRFLASLLYGVKPTDPLTFIIAALVLAGVALLACYIPARRAAKVDPMVALRYE